jgi:TatA/E family protein of Tat protein translocase
MEILVVLVVALVVLGPNRLPDAARSVGRAIGELRRYSSGFQKDVREAFAEPQPYYRPGYDESYRPAPDGSELSHGPSSAADTEPESPRSPRPAPAVGSGPAASSDGDDFPS